MQASGEQAAPTFTITVEIVPPSGSDAEPLLAALRPLTTLPFDAFSVATNPMAKPRMSALAFSVLIQKRTQKPAILHCTARDHNSLSIQSLLWGARALDIRAVLVSTGDFIALGDWESTRHLQDVNVFDLVRKARASELVTGVVLDPHPRASGFQQAVRRLERKIEAGAQFVVTQPIFDETGGHKLKEATQHIGIPVWMGILPLRTGRHARFLHHRVPGIAVPKNVRSRMAKASDPVAEGIANAREMLAFSREHFSGACLMPPFGRYEVLTDILR